MSNRIKHRKFFLVTFALLSLCLFNLSEASAGTIYDIRSYGAKGDGKTLNTNYINQAIADCSNKGGGIVQIPKGVFVSGTLYMKDNVTLHVQEGAVLKGTDDLRAYRTYEPIGDLSQFNSGGDGENANNALDTIWNKALILGVGVHNIAIRGAGIIDGSHVFDAKGEEKMRGPHTILIAESRNISIGDLTINCSANYAFMAYKIENATFENLTFNEGWDGIHIRGGKQVLIRNCDFYTGDDAIAGGYWENFVISDCTINSSCNGIRLIMPADDLVIAHCDFKGPGKYPHRTSKEKKRNNMLSAIILQPGGWGRAIGDLSNIHIHDITIDQVDNPLMVVLNEGNDGHQLLVERLRATNVKSYAISLESWVGGVFDSIHLKDVQVDFVGNVDEGLKNSSIYRPGADARPLPCWGLYARNIKQLTLENVTLGYQGEDARPVCWFQNIAKPIFSNVQYKESQSTQQIISEHSGPIVYPKQTKR